MTAPLPTIRPTSVWSRGEISSFLSETVLPVRLGLSTGDGSPLVCSLWYRFAGGRICCATQTTSQVVDLLRANPVVGFEVAGDAMPYRGIRGQGRATLSAKEGPDVLEGLIERYLGAADSEFAEWLWSRAQNEVAILVEPTWFTSWDFTRRMRAG